MTKYSTLINILDQLRNEAPISYKKYYPDINNIDELNKARSRTFIHLFLKVKFGLLVFNEREKFITDETNDGGVDAYYIDRENKKIYFIQSKFRATEENFEEKNIEIEELYNMELDRITKGEKFHVNGVKFNSKILNLIDEISNINDYPKYEEKVIILANLKSKHIPRLKSLTIFNFEIFDFEKSYNELVFPVVSGAFYNANELKIAININSNSNSNRIDYYVNTQISECNITVLFVPVNEIAQIMFKYRNSILKYNPRSYLDLASGSVNESIKKSIENNVSNEFALFNNGITMLSDNTFYKDSIGRKNEAELLVTNPQIINGGQTAYTLSRILEAINNGKIDESVFNDKEVLLKVITFVDDELSKITDDKKLELIESISKATNNQTAVNEADRRSNEKIQIELQNLIFNDFGYFYERKKGEFSDGIRYNYINRSKVIDRDLFLRTILAIKGNPTQARRSSSKNLFNIETFNHLFKDEYLLYYYAYMIYKHLNTIQKKFDRETHNKFGANVYGNSLRYGKFAVIFACKLYNKEKITKENFDERIENDVENVLKNWIDFEKYIQNLNYNLSYFNKYIDEQSGNEIIESNFDNYYKGRNLNNDLKKFFNK